MTVTECSRSEAPGSENRINDKHKKLADRKMIPVETGEFYKFAESFSNDRGSICLSIPKGVQVLTDKAPRSEFTSFVVTVLPTRVHCNLLNDFLETVRLRNTREVEHVNSINDVVRLGIEERFFKFVGEVLHLRLFHRSQLRKNLSVITCHHDRHFVAL